MVAVFMVAPPLVAVMGKASMMAVVRDLEEFSKPRGANGKQQTCLDEHSREPGARHGLAA
jgi:hypothetical protein